ncbi:MAG TPA: hypothetical protein VH951_01380 [Dehalococcoidia bacterium]
MALTAFSSGGDLVFALAFGGLILLLPLVFRQEVLASTSLLPSALLAIALASSALLAMAILVPSNTPKTDEFVTVNTTFPLPKSIAEDALKKGTEKALADLQAMAGRDPSINAQSHQIAHAIGEISLRYYKTPGEALAHCGNDFQSGCVHGVVIGYLDSTTDSSAFVKMCGRDQIKGSDFVRFNCLHGLGHAALSLTKYDMQQALAMCDTLNVDWDQSSCYGGVFMENVVTLFEGNDFLTTYKPDDHLYPCTSLAERYLDQCYLMQSSVILILNHYDFAEAFTECDGAQQAYIFTCYQSLGREVSGYTLRSAPDSLKICGMASAEMRGGCIVGVAKNFVDFYGRIDEGVGLCTAADAGLKSTCYYAIGEEVGVLQSDLGSRSTQCKLVEAAYVGDCLKGARVK